MDSPRIRSGNSKDLSGALSAFRGRAVLPPIAKGKPTPKKKGTSMLFTKCQLAVRAVVPTTTAAIAVVEEGASPTELAADAARGRARHATPRARRPLVAQRKLFYARSNRCMYC